MRGSTARVRFAMPSNSDLRRLYLLGNPASGRGAGARAIESARALLAKQGLTPTVLPTRHAGHAVELAREAAVAEADLLLVLGGDGTVRDAVEGMGGAEVPVGILPGGTGNDLARTLGLPCDLPAALEIALGGRERLLDVWHWNETPFVNIAGVGLDAAVAGMVNRKFRRLRGTLAYLAAFCMTMPRFRPLKLELTWDGGGWSGRAWLAAFANARCYGGGMQIAPDAVPDDGLLDIVVIEDVPRLELLRQFPGLFKGTHVRHPRVRTFRVAGARAGAEPQDATIDGELIGSPPATLRRAANGFRVRVPGPGE